MNLKHQQIVEGVQTHMENVELYICNFFPPQQI